MLLVISKEELEEEAPVTFVKKLSDATLQLEVV